MDIGLKFYAVPSQPTGATLRSRALVIDFDKFSGKAQVRRATLSCDSSYFYFFFIQFYVPFKLFHSYRDESIGS